MKSNGIVEKFCEIRYTNQKGVDCKNQAQYFANLTTPKGKVDVVLDTDAYNEIDDQFAISYLIRYADRFLIKGICAAPFWNDKSVSPADGMEKSYDEIMKLLTLLGREDLKDREIGRAHV